MKPILKVILFLFVAGPAAAQQKKPNIIFILADDMGYGDAGCYGQQLIKTPNIDQLARDGKRFTQFYAGSTVCAPSRASLMTGKHTGHGYIRGNGELPFRTQDTVLPQLLQQQGYNTGMAGKWGLGLKNTEGSPEKKGWNFFTGYLHHVEGHFQQADSLWRMENGQVKQVAIAKTDYVNELFTQAAIGFIREQTGNKPFFLYLSFTMPHAELVLPPRYLQPYLDSDGSSRFAPEKAQPAGQHYGPQPFPKAAYAGMISAMDDYIGQVLAQLKTQGLEDNTIVIFASDNGTHTEGGRTLKDAQETFHSSGPLRGIKRDMYEGGIRVPFVVRWPGHIRPGSTSAHAGAFYDVLPTFLELAGSKHLPTGDGISFVPALLDKGRQQQHNNLYWEFYEGGFKQAVRQGKWKAIRFYKNGAPIRTELYNLDTDLAEQHNLATTQPAIVRKMENIMDKEHTESESELFKIR